MPIRNSFERFVNISFDCASQRADNWFCHNFTDFLNCLHISWTGNGKSRFDNIHAKFFKSEGKQVYAPDQGAFRAFAQKRYLDKYAKEWPAGAIERINAVK